MTKPKSGNPSLLLPNPTGTVQDDNGTILRGTTSCCDYPPCLCLFVHSSHLYMCACVRALEIAKRSHVSALRPPPECDLNHGLLQLSSTSSPLLCIYLPVFLYLFPTLYPSHLLTRFSHPSLNFTSITLSFRLSLSLAVSLFPSLRSYQCSWGLSTRA